MSSGPPNKKIRQQQISFQKPAKDRPVSRTTATGM